MPCVGIRVFIFTRGRMRRHDIDCIEHTCTSAWGGYVGARPGRMSVRTQQLHAKAHVYADACPFLLAHRGETLCQRMSKPGPRASDNGVGVIELTLPAWRASVACPAVNNPDAGFD